jgi:hypothetical protein
MLARLLLEFLNCGELPLYVRRKAQSAGMQHTSLAYSHTTRGTRNGRNLLGREFSLLHAGRMRVLTDVNLLKIAHCGNIFGRLNVREENEAGASSALVRPGLGVPELVLSCC